MSAGDEAYWEIGQMLGCTMSEDDYDDFEDEKQAVASWISEIELDGCTRLLGEVGRLFANTSTALERREHFPPGLGFLEADGSNFDPLMDHVELLLRDRIARES